MSSTKSTSNIGRFVWYELMTSDPEAAKAFYTHVTGWKTEAFGDTGYTMWVAGQGPVGGVMAPSRWSRRAPPPTDRRSSRRRRAGEGDPSCGR